MSGLLATLFNAGAVIAGGIIGLLFKKTIKKETCNQVLKSVGMVVLLFGILGAFKSMITVNGSTLNSHYELLVIICVAVGTIIGELLRIDDGLNKFACFIEKKFEKDSEGNGEFAAGFTNSTLVFCVGAMAILGSIQAALGDSSTLYLKSFIDGITAIILASTLGYGVLFSSIVIIIYQGGITILGMCLGDFMDPTFVNMFSAVGYLMVAAIGVNFIATTKIKVANMLPALLLVIIYFLISLVVTLPF